MKNIVFLTGAGMSQESGIRTFRDSNDGLWEEYDINKVAHIQGWHDDPELVLNFYNKLRKQLFEYKPNDGHIKIAELEKNFNVTVVTQNVDDLHERAGSTNIIHVHGELLKSRSSINPNLKYACLDDIKIGDLCDLGSQLRPDVVWFGEALLNLKEAEKSIENADILVIIGTSFQVTTVDHLLQFAKRDTQIYYIDPEPANVSLRIKTIKEKAVKGIELLIKELEKYK